MAKIPAEIIRACLTEYNSVNISIPNLSKKYNINYRNLKYAFLKIGVVIEKRGNGHTGLFRSTETKKNISKAHKIYQKKTSRYQKIFLFKKI